MAAKNTGCTVEANGTVVTCACSGCGIAYNHSTKTYYILCCGTIFTSKVKAAVSKDPKKSTIELHVSGATLLEVAQLLENAAPGKVKLSSSLQTLQKPMKFKADLSLGDWMKKLGLKSAASKAK